MLQKEYDRLSAVQYAHKWAYTRNPKYYNFDLLGGDCTNFISQCIFVGSKIMNYDKNNGWYYRSLNDRSPSWTGVEFLYDFLVRNKSVGPFGKDVNQNEIEIGDIIQLSFNGIIYGHNLIVVDIQTTESLLGIKVAAHTNDTGNKAVGTYQFSKIRFIHIQGVRKWK